MGEDALADCVVTLASPLGTCIFIRGVDPHASQRDRSSVLDRWLEIYFRSFSIFFFCQTKIKKKDASPTWTQNMAIYWGSYEVVLSGRNIFILYCWWSLLSKRCKQSIFSSVIVKNWAVPCLVRVLVFRRSPLLLSFILQWDEISLADGFQILKSKGW